MPVELIPGVVSNYSLSRMTTVRTGGQAEYFAQVDSLDDLLAVLRWAEENTLDVAVVGSGSNLLVADEGVKGLVLHLSGDLASIEIAADGKSLVCGGGARLPSVAAYAARVGLSGLEFGINIPGTVGGAVKMNANAYGGQLAQVIEKVSLVDADGLRELEPQQLGFGYRESSIRRQQVVASVIFSLIKADSTDVKRQLAQLRKQRKDAQPSGIKTFGSTFKNPDPELSSGRTAGQLLADAECKKLVVGGATFSDKHANFVENIGSATTEDILKLMALGRREVLKKTGVLLEPEVQFLGEITFPSEWSLS